MFSVIFVDVHMYVSTILVCITTENFYVFCNTPSNGSRVIFETKGKKSYLSKATSRICMVKTAAAKIKETKVFLFRKNQEKFSRYYRMHYYLRVCNNVNGLMEEAGFPHDVNEWKLYKNAYGHA